MEYNNLSIAELVKILKRTEEDYNNCYVPKSEIIIKSIRPNITVDKKDGDISVSFYLVNDNYIYYKPYYLKLKEGEYVKFFEESYSENNRRYNEMWPDNYAEELAIVKNSIIREIQLYET